jgi:hypothetical protein
MPTMPERYASSTEEQRSVVKFFFLTEILNAKNIHKDVFPVYVWKCLSLKAVRS